MLDCWPPRVSLKEMCQVGSHSVEDDTEVLFIWETWCRDKVNYTLSLLERDCPVEALLSHSKTEAD